MQTGVYKHVYLRRSHFGLTENLCSPTEVENYQLKILSNITTPNSIHHKNVKLGERGQNC